MVTGRNIMCTPLKRPKEHVRSPRGPSKICALSLRILKKGEHTFHNDLKENAQSAMSTPRCACAHFAHKCTSRTADVRAVRPKMTSQFHRLPAVARGRAPPPGIVEDRSSCAHDLRIWSMKTVSSFCHFPPSKSPGKTPGNCGEKSPQLRGKYPQFTGKNNRNLRGNIPGINLTLFAGRSDWSPCS